jgi:hypothetical protein
MTNVNIRLLIVLGGVLAAGILGVYSTGFLQQAYAAASSSSSSASGTGVAGSASTANVDTARSCGAAGSNTVDTKTTGLDNSCSSTGF